ncbi:FAD-binding oxidoreductase [Salmonella enterica]|nr:FAD-binding oxidoreductase [Salmonella enterica]
MSRSRGILTKVRSEFLAHAISGRVLTQEASDYESIRRGLVWNGRPPEHYPRVIVEAHSAADVVRCINFARHYGLTVCVRGTGHSYSAIFLRDGGLLLDLAQLDDIVVDKISRQVSVGAGARSGQINAILVQEGLAFPVGHDANVGIGGFLLGGGLGINCAAWGGMSTFSIMAADIVNAEGEMQCASPRENPDLFWALRGGGPGLPFIVTRFHLRCYTHPGAIVRKSWLFRFTGLPGIVEALESVASSLDKRLQVMIALVPAPPALAVECREEDAGRIAVFSAIAFADNNENACTLLDSLPVFADALGCVGNQTITMADIQQQGQLCSASQRFRTDNILCDDPGRAVDIIMHHLPTSPSPDSQTLIVWRGRSELPAAAYSTSGRYFISTYARWAHAEDDQVNAAWLKRFYDDMAGIATGAYINEFDLEGRLEEAFRYYSQTAFERLRCLRQVCDPTGIFDNPYSNLPS